MSTVERVLYDDENGLDLLIDERHNVNLNVAPECLSEVTHQSRNGKNMEVFFHPHFQSYLVCVVK